MSAHLTRGTSLFRILQLFFDFVVKAEKIVIFDIDDSGFNQECYNQCNLNTEILDIGLNCTKLCSGYDSCLDATRDLAYNLLESVLQDACKNINEINKDSDPSTYDTISTNIMDKYGGGLLWISMGGAPSCKTVLV